MKLILSSILVVIISATQQCNDKNNNANKSNASGWTEQTTAQQSSENNQTSGQGETQQQQQQQSQQGVQPAQDPANFRLSVSFYSIGSGTDYNAIQEYDKFIAGYTPKVTVQSKRWGREGEIDYCFRLSELNTEQQADFVKKTREILSRSKLVHINENAPCRN